MYWFFNCNNYDERAIKALVFSGYKHNPHLIPICIWDEPKYQDKPLENWLTDRGVMVIHHKPVLDLSKQFEIIRHESSLIGWGINPLTVNGCWQKVDVPKLCHDLGIQDRYVLLTDPDCLWLDTFEMEDKPNILTAACEEEPFREYISGGIYIWNLPRAINDYNHFLFYCLQNFEKLGHGDNVAYLKYYGYKNLTICSPDWNYKPYWKELKDGFLLSPKEKIKFKATPKLLHFQGHSKPWMDFPRYYVKWYGEDIVVQLEAFNKLWWRYLDESNMARFKFESTRTEVEKFDEDEVTVTPINKICQLIPTI